MIAIMGALAILVNDLCAVWIGYHIGIDRGVEMCRTKRGIAKKV